MDNIVEKLIANNEELKKYIAETFDVMKIECQKLINENESLQRDKAALIEVLEWYGDEENYSPAQLDKLGYIPCDKDCGERARTILSRMK